MQMWSCGLSCRTNCTNLLASFHILSRTYTNTAVVHIFCHQTVPVIDNYPVTGAAAVSGDDHTTGCRGICRCSGRRSIIVSFVSADLKLTNFSKITGLVTHSRTRMCEITTSAGYIAG